jgi:hypothetical protein
MDLADSAAYLRHHLTLVGRTDPLFANDAVARLHRIAGGLSRKLMLVELLEPAGVPGDADGVDAVASADLADRAGQVVAHGCR